MAGWTSFLAQVVGSWLDSGASGVYNQVLDHFTAHGDVVERALEESHQQAWLTIKTALAGPSMMEKVRGALQSTDQQRLTDTVREFAEAHFRDRPEALRGRCLESLCIAQDRGLLALPIQGGTLWPQVREEIARLPGAGSGPQVLPLGPEHEELVALVSAPQPSGRPLLLELCRAFFLLKVQKDEGLMRTLEYVQWEQIPARFADLNDALQGVGGLVEQKLDENRHLLEELRDEVRKLVVHARLPQGELEARHSISIHTDAEKRLVKDLLRQFRELPEDQQHRMVDLERNLGELLFGSGLPEEAAAVFRDAAAHDDRPDQQALAHYNAYRSALERQDWDAALTDLLEAATRDPERFAPFPLDRYTPERILGAGGFGVVFLCKDLYRGKGGKDTVIKALRTGDLTRSPEDVFHELAVLEELRHPRILVPFECGHADGPTKQRPYLKMDYFAGQTLQEHVDHRGMFSADDWREIALAIAETMQVAHAANVLHRDLKPDNLLVSQADGRLDFKIIDFGLAVPIRPLQQSLQHGATASLLGSTAVGTLKYAPPEQRGERSDVRPGPYSDIYSFGKLSCYALFGTTEPRRRHWSDLEDDDLADLLEDCLEEEPESRPQTFAEVAERLTLTPTKPRPAVTSQPVEPVDSDVSPVEPPATKPTGSGNKAGDESSDNSLNLPMIWCPSGTFLMGSPKGEVESRDNEDQVEVTLSQGFWLGKFPVTQAEWQQVMQSEPWKGQPSVKNAATCPATYVDWEEAMAFCQQLTEQEWQAGRLQEEWEYTLPTEAQWEYACRAGKATAYSFGDNPARLGLFGWFEENAKNVKQEYAHTVGQKKANLWGLHDMHGNVWEWCRDWYEDKLPGGTDPEVTSQGSVRVYRGGGWYDSAWYCRSANRDRLIPSFRSGNLGFRVARVLSSQ